MKLWIVGLFLILCLIGPSNHAVVRHITVHGEKEVTITLGSTAKLSWKLDINKETRKERLHLFYCGYMDKVGRLVPLAYTYETNMDKFYATTSKRPPMTYNLNIDDPKGISKTVSAYYDKVKRTYVMEISKIDNKMKDATVTCSLSYKTDYAKDTSAGGNIVIHIDATKSTTAKKKNKINSSKMFLLGTLAASLTMALGFFGAWFCKKRGGYEAIPREEPQRSRRDVEKGNKRKLTRPPTPVKGSAQRNSRSSSKRSENSDKNENDRSNKEGSRSSGRNSQRDNRRSERDRSSSRREGRNSEDSSSKQKPKRPSKPPSHDDDDIGEVLNQTIKPQRRSKSANGDNDRDRTGRSSKPQRPSKPPATSIYENVESPERPPKPKSSSQRQSRSVSRDRRSNRSSQ